MLDTQHQELFDTYKESIKNCEDVNSLKSLKAEVIGKKGLLKKLMGQIINFSGEERKEYGQYINKLKEEINLVIKNRQEDLSNVSSSIEIDYDLLIPKNHNQKGTIHPLTVVENNIITTFQQMGFSVVSGPEMESDYYNFEALNISKDHPARDMQDTFWLLNNMLLRTHTSPCQVRAIEKFGAPLRIIAPGRVFRNESRDASHEDTFHQLEGMVIDKNVSIGNLIFCMKTLLSEVFQKDVTVRLRPGYFPFVEPGFELDIQCIICNGKGCSTCGKTGWVELVPCGMIHENVLRMSNIDPKEYSGFAFGLGISRLVMMRYNIPDVRMINRGDLRELKLFDQFI